MQKFQTTITSNKKLFDFRIKEIIKYRDLAFLFVKRDFISKYKQTVLGPLWAVIQPLLTTVFFTVIFGRLAGLPTLDTQENVVIPRFLFYLAGNICWTYFAYVLNSTSKTFINNTQIMGKVYYPRLITPISTALSGLISFAIQFAMFAAMWVFYVAKGTTGIRITPMLLLIPLTVLELMVLSIGCGIIISSVTTKYRDLAMLVDFGLTLWQYACPVAYGLTMISVRSERLFGIYMLNPVTPVITTFRYAVFGTGYFNMTYYLISWAVSLAIFFLGVLLFNRIEKTFMDTV